MKANTREIWQDRIGRWEASGLNAEAFAAREGMSTKALQTGRWRFNRGSKRLARTTPQFIELASPPRQSRSAGAPFEVTFGSGTRVVIPPHFDRAALEALVEILRGAE